jgi:predicted transcriptional regulator
VVSELLAYKQELRMTIDLSPKVEAQLRAKAEAEGLSLGEYVERLMVEEESRRVKLYTFQQAIDERVASLNRGESLDGEEVMARLIEELDVSGRSRSTR